MKRIVAAVLFTGVSCAFIVGCAKAPEQAVANAKAAIEAAKSGEADRYAASEFGAAQDSLNAALAEIEKQNSAFPLSRNYEKAAKMLASVNAAAAVSQTNAGTTREKVRLESDSALAQASTAVAEARELLKKAPKGKEGKEALIEMSNEVAVVESSLVQAAALTASNDFLGARDKANAGLEKIVSINDELKNAIAKTSKKGRK